MISLPALVLILLMLLFGCRKESQLKVLRYVFSYVTTCSLLCVADICNYSILTIHFGMEYMMFAAV